MSTAITVNRGTFAQGFCWQNPQQYYDALFDITEFLIPSTITLFNFGGIEPDQADRDKPWIRTLPNGPTDDPKGAPEGLYTWYSGKWCRPHPVPPSSKIRMLWVGTTTELKSFDGGDGTDTIDSYGITGPMWEVDSSFEFRFPIGVGDGDTSVAVGDTGGAETVTLIEDNIPKHYHNVLGIEAHSGDGGKIEGYGSSNAPYADNYDPKTATDATWGGDDDGDTVAHNNMPPYIGVYFIKRTARKYYTV